MLQFLKHFTFLLSFLAFSVNVNAQRNAIKHNMYGYLNFLDGVKTYGISYERAVKDKFTWSISGSYGTFRKDETGVVSTGTTERLTLRGFDVMPEVRWYIFSNEYKTAPLGFFIGPYMKLMFLEESYTRLVSDSYDELALEKGFLGGGGFTGGYKFGTDPIALEILAGFGWGIETGFVDSAIVDPLFTRINRQFLLSRLEISLGFLF